MKSKSIISLTAGAILILILVIALPVSTAMAYSDGPNNPTVGVNVNEVGTVAWQNPGNVTNLDNTSASALLVGRVTSNYLQATGYGFSIPDGAIISGIGLTINRRVSDHNAGIYDNVVKLVQDGIISGENRAITNTVWTSGFTLVTYGGPTDRWGIDWSTTDINKTNFGAVISASRTNNGSTIREAQVDSMQITVYYVYPSNMTVSCEAGQITYGDSVLCTVTVTRLLGNETPDGAVNWTTDGIGVYDLNHCPLTGQNGTASCTTTYTPRAVGTGTHLLTASYDGGTYFAPNQNSQTVAVAQKPLTVTADPQTKVFGSPDPDLTYIYSPDLAFTDAFTGTLSRDAGEDVGQYAINQGTLMVNENYSLTYEGNYFEIAPAEAVCSITPYEVTYDGSAHTATGSCVGVQGEVLAEPDLSQTIHTDAGSYQDSWTFSDPYGNYTDQSSTINDIINNADAMCDVLPYDVTYDGLDHTAEGSCDGVDGQALPGLDLSGTTHTNAGSYSDDWTFTHDNYNDQAGSLVDNISQAEASCLVEGWSGIYDGDAHGAAGDCLGVDGTPLAGLDLGNSYTNVPGGFADWAFTDATGNYYDQSATVEIVISRAAPVCTIEGWTGTYDAASHGASGDCLGVDGNPLDGLNLGAVYTNVPGGSADWSFTDTTGNYLDETGSVAIVINKAEALCSVTAYTVEYDKLAHMATGECVGVENEQLAGLDLSGTTHTDLGNFTDSWFFTDESGNYHDLSGSVADEITKRAITVTADAQTKVIGQTDPLLTYQVSSGSLLEGDTFSGSLVRQPGEKPGTYAILQGNLMLPDYYEITYISADFTIVGHVLYMPLMRKW